MSPKTPGRALLARLTASAFALVLLGAGNAFAQASVSAGKDYTVINPPQSTDGDARAEVSEFFAYGCIHCYHLEPKLEAWAKQLPKDVKVKRIPTPFKIRGIDSGPLFYTLETMGMLDKLHMKIFEAANNENVPLGNPDVLQKWLAQQGVDVKKYQEIEKSFSVQSKVSRAKILTANYKVEATPTMTLDGKYLINMQTPEQAFQTLDTLIAASRLAKPGKG